MPKISQMKHKHQAELSKVGRECDEKMLQLMRQLPPCGLKDSAEHKVSESDLLQRLHIQQLELERCCTLQERLNAALDEIERLKTKTPPPAAVESKSVECLNCFQIQMYGIFSIDSSSCRYKSKPKAGSNVAVRLKSVMTDDDDDYDNDSEYNSDDDPEWRQTPMFKRIKKLREEAGVPAKITDVSNVPGKKKAVSGPNFFGFCTYILVLHFVYLVRRWTIVCHFSGEARVGKSQSLRVPNWWLQELRVRQRQAQLHGRMRL